MTHQHESHEGDNGRQSASEPVRPSALTVALISLFAPGLGHLLIGLRARAVAWLGSFIAFGLVVAPGRPGAIWLVSAAVAIDAFVLATAREAADSNVPTDAGSGEGRATR